MWDKANYKMALIKAWRFSALALIGILLFPYSIHAGQFKATRVYDGDTFKAIGHDIEIKVRLVGIDAPETNKGKRKPGITPYAEMLNTPGENGDVEDLGEDDLAILMYTSGTTGTPKGVMLSHGNLMASMYGGAEVWPYGHSDRTLIAVPMNHIYGVLFFHESCAFGSSIVLTPGFDVTKVLGLIKKYNVTILPLVPTMITMMLEHYDSSRHSLKSIKYMISAGAPLAEDTWERAQELFGVELYHGYGLTEASPNVARQLPGRPFKYGSVGPPIPGLAVMIVDTMTAGKSRRARREKSPAKARAS